MTNIGILSDTHSHVDDSIFNFFKDCNLICHAGDIGNVEVAEKITCFKPFVAVYGNIDGHQLRLRYPHYQRFLCEEVDVLMSHIVGYPGRYESDIVQILKQNPPKLLIGGHSHILKVINDKKYNFLFINPGAAGKYGLHVVRTAIRLKIDKSRIYDLEILEIPRN